MLRFVDLEDDQGPDETLLAGIKPLPINRMLQQAGREANSAPVGAPSAGPTEERPRGDVLSPRRRQQRRARRQRRVVVRLRVRDDGAQRATSERTSSSSAGSQDRERDFEPLFPPSVPSSSSSSSVICVEIVCEGIGIPSFFAVASASAAADCAPLAT